MLENGEVDSQSSKSSYSSSSEGEDDAFLPLEDEDLLKVRRLMEKLTQTSFGVKNYQL